MKFDDAVRLINAQPINDEQSDRVSGIKGDATELIKTICDYVRRPAERTIAIRKIHEAVMVAVKGISLEVFDGEEHKG